MHEFSLCQSMVKTLLTEYERAINPSQRENNPRVVAVRLVVGALHQVVEESFRMAYQVLTADTPFEGSNLIFEKSEMLTRCPACHWEGSIDIPFFICKQCGKGGLETLTGKELYVKEMEIAEDES